MIDEEERNMLEKAGWPPEILALLKRTPEIDAVDQMFIDRARAALASAGCRALDFLARILGCP